MARAYDVSRGVQDVLCDFWSWEEGIPYVDRPFGSTKIISATQGHLLHFVARSTRALTIELFARKQDALSERIERAFDAVKASAGKIDEYCLSDAFDYDRWRFGDQVGKANVSVADGAYPLTSPTVRRLSTRDRENLLQQAISELSPYESRLSNGDGAREEAENAIAFWLACKYQSHHIEAQHAIEKMLVDAGGTCYQSPVAEYALRRAYGDHVFRFHLRDRPDICSVFHEFADTVKRIGEALARQAVLQTTDDCPLTDGRNAANGNRLTDRRNTEKLLLDPNATLAPRTIADHYDLPLESLRKRLQRRRKTDLDCFVEANNLGARDPAFLYKIGKIRDIIDAMRAKYAPSGETSG